MKIDFEKVSSDVKRFIAKFPVEIIMCVFFFGLSQWLVSIDGVSGSNAARYWSSMCYFPIVLVLAYTLNMLCSKRLRLIYYASVITVVLLMLVDMKSYVDSPSFGFTILLAAIVLFLSGKNRDNAGFARNFVTICLDLLISALISGVLFLALLIIFETLKYLFGILGPNGEERLALFASVLVFPLLFLFLYNLREDKVEQEWHLPKFIRIVIDFVICPAIVIYTAILYVYFAKIIISWTLPKGGLAVLTVAYFIVALVGRMLQEVAESKYYKWFFRNFAYFSLPPLVMFWIALLSRVSDYGLTELRTYLLFAGIVMVAFVALLLTKKHNRYQLLAVIASCVIVLLTYIPGISAKSIGMYSQQQRFNRYITALNLLDAKTNKLKTDINYLLADSVKESEYEEFVSCYSYLAEAKGHEKMVHKYGNYQSVNDYSASDEQSKSWTRSTPKGISLGDYKYYCGMISNNDSESDPAFSTTQRDDKIDIFYKDQKIMTFTPVANMDRLRNNQDSAPNFNFTAENGNWKVLISRIEISDNGYYPVVTKILIFSKVPIAGN
jgi:hypothetical protein